MTVLVFEIIVVCILLEQSVLVFQRIGHGFNMLRRAATAATDHGNTHLAHIKGILGHHLGSACVDDIPPRCDFWDTGVGFGN